MCLTAMVPTPGISALLLDRPTFMPVAWIGPQSRQWPPRSRIWRTNDDLGILSLARSTPTRFRVLPSPSSIPYGDEGAPGDCEGSPGRGGTEGGVSRWGATDEGADHPRTGTPEA